MNKTAAQLGKEAAMSFFKKADAITRALQSGKAHVGDVSKGLRRGRSRAGLPGNELEAVEANALTPGGLGGKQVTYDPWNAARNADAIGSMRRRNFGPT